MSLVSVFVARSCIGGDCPNEDTTSVGAWVGSDSNGCQRINNFVDVHAEAYDDEDAVKFDILSNCIYAVVGSGVLPHSSAYLCSSINARVLDIPGYYDTQANIAGTYQYYTSINR